MQGSVLVDGFVRGKWMPTSADGTTTMHITPFDTPLNKVEARAVEKEGRELLRFLAPDRKHELRISDSRD